MGPYRLRISAQAKADLHRMFRFLSDRDPAAALRSRAALQAGLRTLESSPFTCRKADINDPLMRELVVAFGGSGYIVLFRIEDAQNIRVLAVRHQRESDYY